MKRIIKIIKEKKPKSMPDYINLSEHLNSEIKKGRIKGKGLKIAFLSSFTSNGFKESIFVKCCEAGIIPDIYIGGYNQYSQEILDDSGDLYKFKPNLVILFIDTKSILQDYFLNPYSFPIGKRKAYINSKFDEIKILIEKLKKKTSAKIVVHNFEVPVYSPMGILENRQDFGLKESVEKLNASLRDFCRNNPRVFLFDYESFCSKIGKDNTTDFKMYYMGDIKLSMHSIIRLCSDYMGYIKPLMSLTKKCIVLDLDNTLWGGIIGEDGIKGIKIGNTPEGRPFMEFQKALLAMFERGVILAISSKNNFNDVVEVFKKHPDMVLRENNFASMRINWNDKVSNIIEIAKELNIGLDSIVFIDDDKLNRDLVRKRLPEVNVVDLPEDPSLYLKTLMEINDFNSFSITDEDLKKGKIYAEQRKRTELQSSSKDINSYLKRLGSIVTIEKANDFSVPRISQLTQKTNQFNMTTKRYLEEDIKKMSNDKNLMVVSIRSKDKFGDNGIVGAAIIKKCPDEWEIDTFLLSCRVIGRKIEESMLWSIMKDAKSRKAKMLKALFIPTKKNEVAKDFYKNNGFVLKERKNGAEMWQYNLSKKYSAPNFIKVIEK
ncbi:MAG TPA: HAD-IIIC family phosphatase [Candidatus Nanoarchaeia archaeon]|nr:HAD-IIIC family phosphatase [Candidatus Nanoarchaeia archaeon]